MGEILTTVIRRHRVTRGSGHAAQGGPRPWRAVADATFDQAPRGLDRIEIVRVRRQAFDRSAALLEEEKTATDPHRIAEIHIRLADIDAHSAESRAATILAGLGFDEEAQRRPASSFSGGWRMRVALAAVLFSEPDLLLLDEPTTGLDPQARHLLWDRLYRLKQRGVTLVLTTHYMDEAEQLCERLVIMDKARIVDEGSPAALIARHSTREVTELRFPSGNGTVSAADFDGLADRIEVLPDRVLLYADDDSSTLLEIAWTSATQRMRSAREPVSAWARRKASAYRPSRSQRSSAAISASASLSATVRSIRPCAHAVKSSRARSTCPVTLSAWASGSTAPTSVASGWLRARASAPGSTPAGTEARSALVPSGAPRGAFPRMRRKII